MGRECSGVQGAVYVRRVIHLVGAVTYSKNNDYHLFLFCFLRMGFEGCDMETKRVGGGREE